MPSWIVHVDMDAFFASVEVLANPKLAGLPLLVGGGPNGREVVTTASYPARRFGIRSGMPLREARARCPEAIFVPVDPPRYLHASERLIRLFERFTPAVEPASIDEVFLDVAGVASTREESMALASRIRSAVLDEERLSCSIGISETKVGAKMASALAKPGGIRSATTGEFLSLFASHRTSDLWGIGPESERALAQLGIRTIGELAAADVGRLEPVFGIAARILVRLARGEGGGDVTSYHEGAPVRSMGHETTFPRDIGEGGTLERHLLLLCDKVSRRLRREGWIGHVVIVRMKRSDGELFTRQKGVTEPVDDDRIIFRIARELLFDNLGSEALRMLGVSVGKLVRNMVIHPLLPDDRRHRSLLSARDRLRDRFGESSLMPGAVLALFQDRRNR